MKKQYYTIKNIMSVEDAIYKLIIGERSNGKSYSVTEYALRRAWTEKDYYGNKVNDYQFAYLRRWREDIKTVSIEEYFADKNKLIKEITGGMYDRVIAYQSNLYFAKMDNETFKIERGKMIGKAMCLTADTHYKSLQFPLIGVIIFEEFITDTYLPNEPRRLMSIVSTIARKRNIDVFLIGNTISRLCPYFREWGLIGVLKQKQGTIDIYQYHGEDYEVNIALEYCKNIEDKNKIIIGNSAKMINSGAWDTDEQPHLPKKYNEYLSLYRVLFVHDNFIYMIELLRDKEKKNLLLFVHPASKESKRNRTIDEQFSEDELTTPTLRPLRKYDMIVLELLDRKKITFSDNLTGTEFLNIIKQKGGKL